jgi:hypothetical protein
MKVVSFGSNVHNCEFLDGQKVVGLMRQCVVFDQSEVEEDEMPWVVCNTGVTMAGIQKHRTQAFRE